MTFLHPGIAVATAAAVALPIIIHLLFRRRRVAMDWAAMELLREAVRRTNRKLKFEQWLVLTLRCLALVAAGLAIAVPIFSAESTNRETRRLVMLVVDNGASSGLQTGTETELTRVLGEIRAMLTERSTHDRVGIVLASKPSTLLLAPTADPAAIEQALGRIEPTQTPSELRGALELARATVEIERAAEGGLDRAARIVVASAFRRASLPDGQGLTAPGDQPKDTNDDVSSKRVEIIALTPASSAPVDVRLVRVDARPSPFGDTVLVRASLTREGASLEDGQTTVRASGAGMSTPPERTVSWEKGQVEATVDFQMAPAGVAPGLRRAGIEITLEDDVLAAGNHGFAAVDVRRDLEIGVVGRRTSLDASELERVPASLWISRALSPSVGSGMRVREVDPSGCDEHALLGLDAVVVARPDLLSGAACDALGTFVRAGGVVVVMPSGESMAQPWAQSLFSRLSVPMRMEAEATDHAPPMRLAEEQPPSSLLASIAPELTALVAPIETKRFMALSGFAAGEVVLAHADGSPFLVAQIPQAAEGQAQQVGSRGLVLTLCAPPELNWTNLPVKPLMVPLLQEMCRAGIQLANGRNEIAVGETLSGEPSATMRLSEGADRGATMTLGADGRSTEVVSLAGVWRSDAGGVVAANVHPSSIALTPNSMDTVRAALTPLGDMHFHAAETEVATVEAPVAAEWSFFFLVTALLLLLVEGVLSRMFSHASLRRVASVEGTVAIVGRIRKRSDAVAVPVGGRA